MSYKRGMRPTQRFCAFTTLLAALLSTACREPSPGSAGAPVTSAPPAVTSSTSTAAAAVTTTAPATSATTAAPAASAAKLTFDDDAADAEPAGFLFGRTGGGKPGRWIVRAEKDAPSPPNALVQLDADTTDNRFPIAVASAPVLADVRVSVRCKPISGSVDRACGLVLRYQDENNYLLTRANALENNVRLYFVKDGRRQQIASWTGAVTSGAWHTYGVEARGPHVEITWDGAKVLSHDDSTFLAAGRAGVWTKADSVTAFDDLAVEPL
jgi:hypothetical protein